jgi:predicted ATP-grasp superfamily ATP-dependent carboligase
MPKACTWFYGSLIVTEVRPNVLVVAAKWWPLSARLAIALLKNGCAVSVVCPNSHPLALVENLSSTYRYGSVNSMASLRQAIIDSHPDVVVPCDDGAASQCRALYATEDRFRPMLERSLGSPQSYPYLESHYSFLISAQDMGLRTPKTRRIEAQSDLIDWHRTEGHRSVVKVGGESGGNGVRMCQSLQDSVDAWQALVRPPSLLAALKRVAVDRETLALWLRSRPRELTVQQYIEGRPANIMVASWQGKVLASMSVAVVIADGPTGASMVVRIVDDEVMRRAAHLIAERFQLSGFFGLDFVIESSSGLPYLIEINPRCTQLGHIELVAGSSLAAAFASALRGQPVAESKAIGESLHLAFFPAALAGGEVCKPYIEAGYHDEPAESPALLAELMRGPWPHRQPLYRAYHSFSPAKVRTPIVYERFSFEASTAYAETVPRTSTG